MSEEINNLKGIFANVNDDMLLRDCGNLYAENKQIQQENQQLKEKYLNAVADYETTKSENQQLKERIDESINYIDQIIQFDLIPFDYKKTDEHLNMLIGILRGGKNE